MRYRLSSALSMDTTWKSQGEKMISCTAFLSFFFKGASPCRATTSEQFKCIRRNDAIIYQAQFWITVTTHLLFWPNQIRCFFQCWLTSHWGNRAMDSFGSNCIWLTLLQVRHCKFVNDADGSTGCMCWLWDHWYWTSRLCLFLNANVNQQLCWPCMCMFAPCKRHWKT